MTSQSFDALILAGNRRESDSVADFVGVSHKALAPINGIPMLLRLYRTLQQVRGVSTIYICIDDSTLLNDISEFRDAHASGKIKVIKPEASPAASLHTALNIIDLRQPLLITTADHPLLTPDMVSHMLSMTPAEAELSVGLADSETVTSVYPNAVRTFYRFQSRRYSGCNLFLVRGKSAMKVAAYWQSLESHRKKPWRLIWQIGPLVLLRMIFRQLDLDSAFKHLSHLTGAHISPVILPFAEASIDVDKPADYQLATEILRRREGVL